MLKEDTDASIIKQYMTESHSMECFEEITIFLLGENTHPIKILIVQSIVIIQQ